MTERWARTDAGRRENASAAVVALAIGGGVAAVAFYLTRLLLARERITGITKVDRHASPDADAG